MLSGVMAPGIIQDRQKSSKIPMIMRRERSQGVDHELQVMIDAILEWGHVKELRCLISPVVLGLHEHPGWSGGRRMVWV